MSAARTDRGAAEYGRELRWLSRPWAPWADRSWPCSTTSSLRREGLSPPPPSPPSLPPPLSVTCLSTAGPCADRGPRTPPFPRRCRGAPSAVSSPGHSRPSQPCLARSLSVIARLTAFRGCCTDHHMMLQAKWKMRCAGCIPHRRAQLRLPCSAASACALRTSGRRPRPSMGTGPPGTAGTGAQWDGVLSSGLAGGSGDLLQSVASARGSEVPRAGSCSSGGAAGAAAPLAAWSRGWEGWGLPGGEPGLGARGRRGGAGLHERGSSWCSPSPLPATPHLLLLSPQWCTR